MAVYFFLGRHEHDGVREAIESMGFARDKLIDSVYISADEKYRIAIPGYSERKVIEIQGEGVDPRPGKLSSKAHAFLEQLASALKPVRITDGASRDVLPELVRVSCQSR